MLAISTLLYGRACYEMRKSDIQKIKAETRFLLSVRRYAGLDKIMREEMKKELGVLSMNHGVRRYINY
jgi:hypothetical protein